jgi:hypothetical protein
LRTGLKATPAARGEDDEVLTPEEIEARAAADCVVSRDRATVEISAGP